MPIMFTTWDAIRFVGTRSPDLDAMTFWIPPGILLPLLVIATISQTLMLLLSLVSAATGKPPGSTKLSAAFCSFAPLQDPGSTPCSREQSLQRRRIADIFRRVCSGVPGLLHRQVAESATSALVQTNFLISALGGVSQIQALELSEEQLQSMQLSVAVSCLSLGLGFASRDKADSAVLGLPGKLGWDATMAALVLTRSMEVSSRVFAYNILQVSVRGWPLLRFGSLVAVGLVLVSARLLFPDASLADVAAPWQGALGGQFGSAPGGVHHRPPRADSRAQLAAASPAPWRPCAAMFGEATLRVRSGAFRDCRDEAFAVPPRPYRRGCWWITAPSTYQRSSRCIEGHPPIARVVVGGNTPPVVSMALSLP